MVPEIQYVDLTHVVLILMNFNINIFKFDFIDTPDVDSLVDAIEFLERVGAIKNYKNINKNYKNKENDYNKDNDYDYNKDKDYKDKIEYNFKITKYGYKLLSLPFDPKISNFYYHCLKENLFVPGSILCSFMNFDNLNFNIARKDNDFKNEYHEDLKGLIKLMIDFANSNDKKNFCKSVNVRYESMKRIYFIYNELQKKYKFEDKFENKNSFKYKEIDDIFDKMCHADINIEGSLNTNFYISDSNYLKIQKIFSYCFKENASEKQSDGSYKVLSNGCIVFIHPTSLFFRKRVKKIVFYSACSTSKMYAKIVSRYIE
ncbi:Pre-mRNA-splicing factor ATP-dependent RNA helicase DEAH10 [Dictyocoela muelleri]|nr:Pre-mRNA-splicing factor ATP-dependent RNA helicase DEAH10 [Dictyocoela muelleri]